MKFLKNYVISGEIELMTGLHIGGLKETIEIGGTDNPVIRTYLVKKGQSEIIKIPYIPGSSLKGKIRALLEYSYPGVDIIDKDAQKIKPEGYIQVGENYIKYPENCLIPKVFGVPAEDGKVGVSRAVFRDAFPTEETIKWWEEQVDLIEGAEIKTENAINRLTSKANPRQFERVPAGSKFCFEIVLTVYEEDRDDERGMLELLLKGMKMLEDSYLGGSGTRGYGKVRFRNIRIAVRDKKFYEGQAEENVVFEGGDANLDVREILSKLK